MKPEPENDTEVQRMLALKRHEQPPVGFFHGFSDKVIDRIQTAGPAPKLTWRERLSAEFYGVPVYVCLVGVVVFALLVAGLLASLRLPPPNSSEDTVHSLVPPPPKTQIGGDPKAKEGSPVKGVQPMSATLVPETSGK
jgi:hypothetical protein